MPLREGAATTGAAGAGTDAGASPNARPAAVLGAGGAELAPVATMPTLDRGWKAAASAAGGISAGAAEDREAVMVPSRVNFKPQISAAR